MKNRLVCLASAVVAMACLSQYAWADPIVPIGYVSYDVTDTNVAQFDITNLTGSYSLTPDFPVTSSLDLTDLSLTVYFDGNVSVTYGSSYFTLDGNGVSWNGDLLSTLSGAPTGLFGAISATLTGTVVESTAQLNYGDSVLFETSNFSATITDSSGYLQNGDLAEIDMTVSPEPSTWLLLGTGVLGFLILARGGRFKRHLARALPFACLMLLLPAASHAQSAVTLSTVTTPSTGVSGGAVSITGSGYPSGTITPAEVSIGVAATCGSSETSATPILVTKVLGTVYKIQFTVPGLSAGTYYISISGTSSTGNSFASSNCAKLVVASGVSTTLSIDTSRGNTDWVITNGAMTIDYNANTGAIWSVVPTGTTDQLIDFHPGSATINGSVYDSTDGASGLSGVALPAGWNGPTGGGWDVNGNPVTWPAVYEPKGFYMALAGFTTSGTEQPGYSLTSDYIDFWVSWPAYATGSTVTNATEYEEHFVVTPNDPGIHLYFSLNHPTTVPVGVGGTTYIANTIGTVGGQVQWTWRDSVSEFTHMYHVNADLSMVNPVITPLLPVSDMFSNDPGREVQDASGYSTIDLHPEPGVTNAFSPYPSPGGIPEGYSRNYYVKYSFGGYEYLHQAHGAFGDKYGLWAVVGAGHDTFTYGPQKQNLFFTGGILTIEPLSSHYTYGMANGAGSTYVAATKALTRIFGPMYVRINHFGMNTISSVNSGAIQTPADMYADAVAAGASFTNFYNNEAVLVSKGYVPTTRRGSVSVQVSGVTGTPKTAWVVLSDPNVNQQYNTFGNNYWADISSTGTAIIPNVVPGTYRLSVYVLGKWGEYRQDNVIVTAGNTTTIAPITFQPESFGATIGTIGTPDRSCHEFLHGAHTTDHPDTPKGYDDREYWGNWNYWADFATNPTNTVAPGAVVYNLTDGPNGPATNNPLAWNYTHWAVYNPPVYGGAYNSADDTTDGYKYLVPGYVSGLSGATGTNGVSTPVPAWQIHFATPTGAAAKAYVDLSVGLAMAQSTYSLALNGSNSLSWTNTSGNASDSSERSGLSGFTEWVVFQWPTSALKPEGADNVITINVSGTNKAQTEGGKVATVANNSDDALRLEISNTGANPTVTGWHDYEFVTSGTDTAANDTVANP
jgi:hypothetical protein